MQSLYEIVTANKARDGCGRAPWGRKLCQQFQSPLDEPLRRDRIRSTSGDSPPWMTGRPAVGEGVPGRLRLADHRLTE